MNELLAGYNVVIEIPVAWGDMDAFGHVNNAMFFRYFESARMAYLEKVGFIGAGATGIGPILASTQCRFRRPLAYPDTVMAGARVIELRNDRFTHEYTLISSQNTAVAAEGSGVIVAYDYAGAQTCIIPTAVRARIEQLDAVTMKESQRG